MGTGPAPTASARESRPQKGWSCWEHIPGVMEGPHRPHLENGMLQTGSGWPARRKDPEHKHGPPVATITPIPSPTGVRPDLSTVQPCRVRAGCLALGCGPNAMGTQP